jgi:hypothetical protein
VNVAGAIGHQFVISGRSKKIPNFSERGPICTVFIRQEYEGKGSNEILSLQPSFVYETEQESKATR